MNLRLIIQSALICVLVSQVPGALASVDALTHGHSHNDYLQVRPLLDALENHLYSVEADIWLRNDRILVSHHGLFFQGALEEAYLQPLQERVNRLGSVHGDGRPFYLWLDIKENNTALLNTLIDLLDRYPMLSTYLDSQDIPGPVTVVLTGDDSMKRRLVEDYPIRKAVRDALSYHPSDPDGDNQWPWYTIRWNRKVHRSLCELVSKIHEKNRRVRFYGVPRREKIWKSALDCGADLIGADNLFRLRNFLDSQP